MNSKIQKKKKKKNAKKRKKIDFVGVKIPRIDTIT
jgi:hypothetical protein